MKKYNKKEALVLMGSRVLVTKRLVSRTKSEGIDVKDELLLYWESEQITPRYGWIVGFRRTYNRLSIFDTYHHRWVERCVSNTPCILVSFWPTQNPVKIPLDGFELIDDDKPQDNKFEPTYAPSRWTKEEREYASTKMSAWPRDANGRWN